MIKLPKKSIDFFKNNLDNIFETGALAEGEWNAKLSKLVEKYTKAKFAIPTCSNGSGVVALLQIFKKFYGRKAVMIQSNTMYGVKTMVSSGSCDFVGCINSSKETLMPTLNDVKSSIDSYKGNKNELIFLLSHIGGIINPDIIEIAELCKENNIILIEDCAHSYGATLKEKHSGLFGDAGVYSFYATKAIPAGEGGVVVTNNSTLAEYCKKFIIYDRFDQQLDLGINVRMSEVQALLVYSVCKEVDEILSNKYKIAEQYIKTCEELNISYLSQETNDIKGNYYKFILLDENCNVDVKYGNIKTKTSPVYDYVLGNSTDIATSHICLPIWYGQEQEITDKVIEELTRL